MKTHDRHEELEKRRELLERSANRTRERLVETLEALDHRRHEITDVKGQVKKQVHEHAKALAATAGTLILGISALIGVSIYHAATRKRRLREERVKALKRLWLHPERLARKSPQGSFASDVGRKVLTSALTFVALEQTLRTIRRAGLPAHGERALPHVIVRTLPA